jgi:hypothetical protein
MGDLTVFISVSDDCLFFVFEKKKEQESVLVTNK